MERLLEWQASEEVAKILDHKRVSIPGGGGGDGCWASRGWWDWPKA